MKSYVVPPDAPDRPEWADVLAAGARPNEIIIIDGPEIGIVRYPTERDQRLIRRGLTYVGHGAFRSASARRATRPPWLVA